MDTSLRKFQFFLLDGYHFRVGTQRWYNCFRYETSDGTSRQEQGELKNAGTENEALVVRGSISWIGDDGKQYTITFVADENGFQPQGDHLPKAP